MSTRFLTFDLTDEEKLALEADHYPLSPRIRPRQVSSIKIEPPSAVIAKAFPTKRPGDRPRATLAAGKRRRRG